MSETLVTCKDRTYTVQQKGCAERIAPIGTLSQNGYGEHLKVYTSTHLMTNRSAAKFKTEQTQEQPHITPKQKEQRETLHLAN